jgi:hypothetical protein
MIKKYGTSGSSGAAAFDPKTSAAPLMEEFDTGGYFGSGQIQCNYNWASLATGSPSFTCAGSTITSSNTHPGVLQISIAALNEGGGFSSGVFGSTTNSSIVPGGGTLTFETLIYINAISNGTDNGDIGVGFMDNPIWNAPTNMISIQYKVATSNNWLLLTDKASTLTTVTSSIAVTQGWHRVTFIVDSAAANVNFYIDGVLAGTSSTNIPTTKLPIVVSYRKVLGTGSMALGVDYIYVNNVFASARAS